MDEDECDLTSPIGQIIKHINVICKKPQIDNQLGEALDLFSERINEQQKYLSNGIFNTNFAEAALFLQSCAELYGKKVDLLWDELISCLTRLVQYDCEHEKEQGKEINQDVITKLEERREKFKRKRKSKKAEEEAKKLAEKQNNQNSETLPKETVEQSLNNNNNTLNGIVDNPILENEQHENLEFSQIPGWNDIQCLFEQIDEKQLPDKNNLLSILKVCAYGRMQFLQQKKLPLNEPFSTHKEEYLKFRNKFFENAVKKWENVTLETFEDLHKVLIYLSQKEKKKTTQTKRLLEIPQLEKPSMQDINQKVNEFLQHSHEVVSEKETVQFLEHSDDDSLFELSFICDENNTTDKNNLFVHLEQLSCDIINNKLRQDSGFYDFNSDESCHSNDTQNFNGITLQENSIPPSNTTNEVSECPEISTSISDHTISEQTIHQNLIMNFEEDKENQHPSVEETLNDTNCDTSSVLSDHDYCSTVTNVRTHGVRLGKRKNSRQEELLQNIINHKYCIACQTPKIHKEKCSKEKDNTALKDKQLMPPPAKKRKLTHKQIIKLLESVVPTVQENNFEKFFSENYQPGEGEGEIIKANLNEGNDENVEDMSENDDQDDDNVNDDEDEEEDDEENEEDDTEESNENTPDATTEEAHSHNTDDPGSKVSDHIESLQPNDKSPLEDEETPAPPAEDLTTSQILENLQQSDECMQRQSDMDDTLSVFSEHSYCQPRENLRNDSGFVDMIEEEEEPEPEANIETLFTRIDDIVADKNEPFSIEEEYQRLLHLLEESQKDMIDEQAGRPTEKQRREQEALELQRRVQEWENMIVPKLNELNGQDFDIHEYGTKIMDGIEVNESKPFGQIVQGLTSAEVTRYFISSLQLANTNNIELCGVKSGDISNDTFEIKLLNRDRYHEHLNDYQAPSKETLRERLDRLRSERTSGKEYSKQGEDVVEKYPKKRRKLEAPVNNNYSLHNSSANINITEPSTSQERSNDAGENYFQRDSNNNGNKNKVHMDRNSSSKSTNDNPQKGKSIKRKLLSTNNHVSFEGCQAPQALSVQITSPRQLHTTSLSHWNQPSTSHRNSDSSERFLNEASFDESALERDFQRLAEVQKFYPRNQMQSTPRNDLSMTFSQSTVYSSTVGPKILFN